MRRALLFVGWLSVGCGTGPPPEGSEWLIPKVLRIASGQSYDTPRSCAVTVENVSSGTVEGRVIIRWRAGDGREIAVGAVKGTPVKLAPGERITIVDHAPVSWAATFTVEFR